MLFLVIFFDILVEHTDEYRGMLQSRLSEGLGSHVVLNHKRFSTPINNTNSIINLPGEKKETKTSTLKKQRGVLKVSKQWVGVRSSKKKIDHHDELENVKVLLNSLYPSTSSTFPVSENPASPTDLLSSFFHTIT